MICYMRVIRNCKKFMYFLAPIYPCYKIMDYGENGSKFLLYTRYYGFIWYDNTEVKPVMKESRLIFDLLVVAALFTLCKVIGVL